MKTKIREREINRFLKQCITIILTGVAVVYGNDPRYIALAPLIDRARAYIFRKLKID